MCVNLYTSLYIKIDVPITYAIRSGKAIKPSKNSPISKLFVGNV